MCKSSAPAILRSSSFDHVVIADAPRNLVRVWTGEREIALRTQQRLDRAAFVHRAVPLRHLIEGQRQVEDLARIDLPLPHEVDQLGKEAAHWRGTAMQMDVRVEELFDFELDSVRDSDEAHVPAFAGGTNRLHHRLLSSNA